MRVAVFSDVQGNISALETVVDDIERWNPDLVVMNGDLINRGPMSAECLSLMLEKCRSRGWLALKGNHEEYVLYCAGTGPQDEIDAQLRGFVDWTVQQLGSEVYKMQPWADHMEIQAPGSDKWLHITHGTLAGNRDGVSPSVPLESLPPKLPRDIDIFITAHTHKPLELSCAGTRILNVGSAGTPFDGDVRASYARFQFHNGDWESEIVRLEYDRERMAKDCRESGFLDQSGPLARIIYREWQDAVLLMPFWNREYRRAVIEKEISLERAVDQFLTSV